MEDFVTIKIAKKLKDKGFREECFARYYCNDKVYFEENSYHPDTESIFYCYNNDKDLSQFYIDAPTISQVLKWLREEKKIHITILIITDFSTDADNNICEEWSFWSFYVTNLNDGSAIYDDCQRIDNIEYQSYEESAIAGIEYVLDNLI